MLDELVVRNFGIIEEISWRPGRGLNVITGETGAGKSLVVDAVDALLSGQVKEEDIRHGADAARVEGVFSLPPDGKLAAILEAGGLAAEEETLVLTCDFRRQGRSVPRADRQAVSRSLMREIGTALVDIHGQSEHLSLLKSEHHLDFLDAYAHTLPLREEFAAAAAELHGAERELAAIERDERDMARRLDLLDFQVEEIRQAELHEGEEEELKNELTVLSSAEKLKAAAQEVYRALEGNGTADTGAAIDILNGATVPLRNITAIDAAMREQLVRLEAAVTELGEMAREIRAYGDNCSFDPERLEEVQARLELLRSLKRKYGDSVAEILEYAEKAERERQEINSSDEHRRALETEIRDRKVSLGELGAGLSSARSEAATGLAAAVEKELAELNMGRVVFAVSVTREAAPDGIPLPDSETVRYTATGLDNVAFQASTNPGEPLKPLEKIASTGEISRFLLALKSALAAADTTPVLIFDEIDIGVGGRSGEVIGRKLWGLSRHHQVICVTHLPQIAAFADCHFTVRKAQAGDRTVSTIETLEDDERLAELAVMIGGSGTGRTTLDAARDLVASAEKWKSSR